MGGIVDLFLHLDKHLTQVVTDYQTMAYLFLFAIVFAETGLVVTPFLPGDSLLFAAGAIAAMNNSPLSVGLLYVLFFTAALTGDNVNYFIGKTTGHRLFSRENSRLFKRRHLEKTQAFFAKHGGKTLIIARFVPIVRTFAPFVAGMGTMSYSGFIRYSIAGACLWVGSCVTLGYFFGNIPTVKKNFPIVVIAVILLSLLPPVFEWLKHRRHTRTTEVAEPAEA